MKRKLAGYIIVYYPVSFKLLTACYLYDCRTGTFTTDLQEAVVFKTHTRAVTFLNIFGGTPPENYLQGTILKVYEERTLVIGD